MAKIVEEIVTVKLSKLVKNDSRDDLIILDEEKRQTLLAVVEGLIDSDSVIVEVV